MTRLLRLATILALSCGPATATDRFYMDCEGKSPNGRFEARSTSPENALPGHRAFQRDFTVVLRDSETKTDIWTWKQGEGEASPVELIPTDDGLLIMQDAWSAYHVFDKSGRRTKVLSVLSSMARDELDRYTQNTTAGVFWHQFSSQGFYRESDRDYFYLRTFWGHLFVIDLATPAWIRDEALVGRVETHIVSLTRGWLAKFDGVFLGPCGSCSKPTIRGEVARHAFIIRQYGLSPDDAFCGQVIANADDSHHPDIKHHLALMSDSGAFDPKAASARTLAIVVAAVSVALLAVLFALLQLRRRSRAAR